MQLSIPVPIFPTPTAPSTSGAINNSALVDPSTKASPESPNQCFESFFPKKEVIDDQQPDSEEQGTDPEKDAAILAASFWMPIMQPAPAPQPVLSAGLSANPEAAAVVAPVAAGDSDTEVVGTKPETSEAKTSFCGEPAQHARASLFSGAFNSRILGQPKFQAPASAVADEPVVSDLAETPAANVVVPEPTTKTSIQASVDQTTIARVAMPAGPVSPLPLKRVAPVMTAMAKTEAKTDVRAMVEETSPELSPSTEFTLSQPINAAEGTTLSPDVKVAAQPAKQPVLGQEKFAAPQSLPLNDTKSNLVSREKHFLDVADKVLKEVSASVGISVAKPVVATMPNTASARTKSASTPESTAAFVFSAETASMATSLTVEAPTPISHVREAVAAVINAVDALERAADVQKKSVDLQFNVGHEKLDLRVELRDGIVHTTFRTESPEMNRSLAREWNSIVSPALAREVRLAEPVFSSSSSNDQSSFGAAGQGSSQQRNEYKAPTLFTSSVKRDFYESSTAEVKSSVSPATNSSQILNALA